ncbi:heat shock protein [Bordetella pertussis]|nr:heat shock protein [Bordetella pertussis]
MGGALLQDAQPGGAGNRQGQVNGQPAKPAREVAPGDVVCIRKEDPPIHVRVCAVSGVRGPAPVARQLYEETPESAAARERAAEMRRLAPEPAMDMPPRDPEGILACTNRR